MDIVIQLSREKADKRKRVKLIGNNESPININHHSLLWSLMFKEESVIFSKFIQLSGLVIEV